MSIKVPRLKQNRHGVFCLRVIFTDNTGKRREQQHSLGTKSPSVARLLALKFNLELEQQRQAMPKLPNIDDLLKHYKLDLSKGLMESDGAEDHQRMMEALNAYKAANGGQLPTLQEAMAFGRHVVAAPRIKSMIFSEATAHYLEEKKLENAPQTLVEKGRTYKDFIGIFGDVEINLITKAEIVQWKTADLKRGLGANRINKRLGQVNDFFNWSINHGHYTAHPTSPVEGLFLNSKKVGAKVEHYEPFTNDDLKAIFGDIYSEEMKKPDKYFLPLVALFSGARREEIAGLRVDSVKEVDGVKCFQIEKGKTADSRRLVPIHSQLVALGFWRYVEQVKALGAEYLFPYLNEGANGRGKNVGRQFGLLLEKVGIKDDRKVFHSFRHTVITRLHTLGLNTAHVMQLTGHRGEAGQSVHFGTYTHDIGLKALSETLETLTYPIDFEKIKGADFSVFLKRWDLIEKRKAHVKKAP